MACAAYRHITAMDTTSEKIQPLLFVCNWMLEKPPLMHKDKYLEIRNLTNYSMNYIPRIHGAACVHFFTVV